MQLLVWTVCIVLFLALLWAGWYDHQQRRRGAEPHDIRGAARDVRTRAEGKGTEWGS
jgi:hypothetical protein